MPDDARPPDPSADTIASETTVPPSKAIGLVATSVESDAARASRGALPERYQLGGTLGSGGMGEVLLASDHRIGREVAIKRMLVTSESLEVRFLREAKIQGRLDHPAVVPVHDLATDSDGRPFFVMKRLSGMTLATVLADHAAKFSRQRLLRAFADVCLAIEFAHRRGIVHRDLKPANIMLGDFGEVYVLDWGIARILDETDDLGAPTKPARPDATEVGAILGTLGYMAPEQRQGLAIDARADVFALGCILFEILAGQPLLPRTQTLEEPFPEIDARPSRRAPDRETAPELEALVVDATRIELEHRLPSARVLAEGLERFLDGDRDLALRKRLALTHLDTARTALASGDDESARANAMREAGRAIALDPTCNDAAELVSSLMLEPPKTVPVEVHQRLAQIDDDTARRRGILMSFISLGFVGFLPVLAWIGITDATSVTAFAIAVVLNGSLALFLARRAKPASVAALHLAAIANAVVTAMLARMFTPFLVAPGIAAISIMMLLADPRMRAKVLIPVTIGAVLIPWTLEVAGVWSRTVRELAGDLMLHSPSVTVRLPHTAIALALYVTTLVALSGLVTKRLGESQRASLRSLELQAWHLRQLVRR